MNKNLKLQKDLSSHVSLLQLTLCLLRLFKHTIRSIFECLVMKLRLFFLSILVTIKGSAKIKLSNRVSCKKKLFISKNEA